MALARIARQNTGALAHSFRVLCASRRELFLSNSSPIREELDKKSSRPTFKDGCAHIIEV